MVHCRGDEWPIRAAGRQIQWQADRLCGQRRVGNLLLALCCSGFVLAAGSGRVAVQRLLAGPNLLDSARHPFVVRCR